MAFAFKPGAFHRKNGYRLWHRLIHTEWAAIRSSRETSSLSQRVSGLRCLAKRTRYRKLLCRSSALVALATTDNSVAQFPYITHDFAISKTHLVSWRA